MTTGFTKIQTLGGITEYLHEPNSLSVLLMEDHTAPVLTFMVTYRVGSRNEATGTTGATHLLEHLMFKGTDRFNKEKGTQIAALLQNVGARMNATTWYDRTNYYENLPSDQAELAVQIEADRMRNSRLRAEDLKSEMTVVRNEFDQGENHPYVALDKNIWATAYQAHPYHHSTIGWRSDIENMTVDDLRNFYDTYYWPNNATASIIGDIQTDDALSMVKKYFGSIPASPNPIPPMYTEEPKQQGPRHVVVRRTGQLGVVGIAHKTPRGLDPDTAPLLVLQAVLTRGKTSRLYRRLVDGGLTTSFFGSYHPFHDPGLFTIYAFLTPGTKHGQVERVILEALTEVREKGIRQEELIRAKKRIAASTLFGRDGSYAVAAQLNEAIAIGDWTYYVRFLEGIQKVKTEDVKRVANTWFEEDQRTTGFFIPRSDETEDEKKNQKLVGATV